jgi:hypothetical protein
MTGNGSGWTDPGIYAHPQRPAAGGYNQSQATQGDTAAAYDDYGLHHYRGDVQNLGQVNQAVSKQDQSRFGPLFGPLLNLLNGHGEVDDKLTSAAKSLKQGLDIRSAPPAVNAHYQGISHQALYDSVTKNVDPASVGEVSDTWLQIGNKLTNLQTTVAQSIASSQVTWSGHAAEKARQSIAKLGNQSGSAGQSAQLAGVLTAHQSEALSSAKNSIPPPPDPPFDATAARQQLQTIQDPIAFATQAAADHAQASAQQAAHQMAAHVVQQYDQTVSQTSASMPAFAPAPPVVKGGKHVLAGLPGASGPVGGPGGGGGASLPRVGSGSGSGVGGVGAGTGGAGGRHAAGGGVAVPPDLSKSQQTSVAAFVPPADGGVSGVGPGGGGVTGGGGGLGVGGAGAGGLGAGGLGIGGFGAAAGVGDSTGFGGGAGAGSGGAGGGGGGKWTGSGAGARAVGADGSGGSRSGVGGAAAADEAAALRGAPGARGAGGMGAMGGGRGAKGQGDSEHKRPAWLVENDEGIFGTDELTAPPVIGE